MQSQIENLNERAWKPELHAFAWHKGIQSAQALRLNLISRIDKPTCHSHSVKSSALLHLPASRLRELLDDDCDVVISRVPRGVYRCFQFAQCTVFEQPNEQSRILRKWMGKIQTALNYSSWVGSSATQISTYERWLAAVSYTLLPDNLL
jgi:hypothetical protein